MGREGPVITREAAAEMIGGAGTLGPGATFPLLEAAIACATHEDPGRDPQPVRDLAAAGLERLTARLRRESQEEALAETMAGDLRLSGDLLSYDHPDNADIIALAQRRKGLPVTLAFSICKWPEAAVWMSEGWIFQATSCCGSKPWRDPWPLTPSARGR